MDPPTAHTRTQDASAAYLLALTHLITHPGDAAGAAAAAEGWARRRAAAEVLEWLALAREPGPGPAVHLMAGFLKWGLVHAFRCVEGWRVVLREGCGEGGSVSLLSVLSLENRLVLVVQPSPTTLKKQNYRNPITRMLHQPPGSYIVGIRHILQLGGDVDTNACIVGALLGALFGAAAIPVHLREAVVTRGCGSGGRPRPPFLQGNVAVTLVRDLLAAAGDCASGAAAGESGVERRGAEGTVLL